MKVSDFDFYLPQNLIAQTPLEKREESKLLVINRKDNQLTHQHFSNIIDYFDENDVLIINNSKVLPARLHGIKESTNAHIEILLLKEIKKDIWEVLVKPARRVSVGTVVFFSNELSLEILETKQQGLATAKLIYQGILIEILESLGEMPLPPYIKEKLSDNNRYQTVYAKILGSAAAPTAGFHFTEDILSELRKKNVEILEITLHVGLATFRPVSVSNVLEHQMHEEIYTIDEKTVNQLNQAMKLNKRITAVGTTTVRALESNYTNKFNAGTFATSIFIYPGYQFRVIDHIITNFHLPKSTLLMLVSAFYEKDNILRAYQEAIKHNYRFFSFGDSMLIY